MKVKQERTVIKRASLKAHSLNFHISKVTLRGILLPKHVHWSYEENVILIRTFQDDISAQFSSDYETRAGLEE